MDAKRVKKKKQKGAGGNKKTTGGKTKKGKKWAKIKTILVY